MMKKLALCGVLSLAFVPAVYAQNKTVTCTEISGNLNEFILPQASAPSDPFGRILGTVKGSLEGSVTAFLTTFVPAPSGDVHVTNNHAFATLEGNQLFTRGAADWLFVKNGFYQVDMTLVVAGGTGKYSSATGSIHLLGVGNNIAPGTGQFVDEYRGTICTQ
jgi:hypothetical protein